MTATDTTTRTHGYTYAPGNTIAIERDGYSVLITCEHDGDLHPAQFPDAYTEDDINAWCCYEWCYLTLTATAILHGMPEGTDYLGGVESHSSPEHFAELFEELVTNAVEQSTALLPPLDPWTCPICGEHKPSVWSLCSGCDDTDDITERALDDRLGNREEQPIAALLYTDEEHPTMPDADEAEAAEYGWALVLATPKQIARWQNEGYLAERAAAGRYADSGGVVVVAEDGRIIDRRAV